MRIPIPLFIKDTFGIHFIDTYPSGGMYNSFSIQHNTNMRNLSIRIIKERQIPRFYLR